MYVRRGKQIQAATAAANEPHNFHWPTAVEHFPRSTVIKRWAKMVAVTAWLQPPEIDCSARGLHGPGSQPRRENMRL